MKILFLIVFGWASLTMSAKNNIYGNKTEQRAIKMAYTLLQVYYHSNELCVSDSIEDLEWFLFSDMVDNQTKQILDSYRKEKILYGMILFIVKKLLRCSVLRSAILAHISLFSLNHIKE